MKRTVGMGVWTVAALIAVTSGAVAQESKDAKPAGVEETAGPRLLIRFLETRQRGEKTTTVQPCILMLHTGDKAAQVFVGTQVALRTSDKGTPTVIFKNAGVYAQVRAQALPDGRYRLEARFEESSVLAASSGETTPSNGGNPILQVVKGESVVVLREGETAPFASAVDPVTGDVVRVDVAIDMAPVGKVAAAAGDKDARLRARFVLNRRRGDTRISSRPYSVVVQAGEEKAANVFSGAMLPLEVSYEGQPTVMLKDIGAGVRLGAHRIGDGRYRIDLSVSDGTLSAANGSPRVQAFQAETRLFLRAGETVVIASAADPQTGDVVEAALTIEADR
jgi:hypothetical protein